MSLTGQVKLFNPNKGFGFITTPEGTDVFLHIKACVDEGVPQTGDIVAFDMGESPVKPGQMQASNVSGGTGVAGAGKGGGSTQGQCKSFNEAKGFGFIVGADGSDIFFHTRGIVDGSTPQAGDVLKYDLEASRLKPDQVQAHNIAGGTGYGKGGGKGFDKGGYGAAKGGWGGGKDSWGGGGKDAWGGKDAGKGGWGGGGDSWGAGPYGGGKGGKDKGKDGGKSGKMQAMMAMMESMWGGGDSWGGDDSWSGGGAGAWGGKGGKGGGAWKGAGW